MTFQPKRRPQRRSSRDIVCQNYSFADARAPGALVREAQAYADLTFDKKELYVKLRTQKLTKFLDKELAQAAGGDSD